MPSTTSTTRHRRRRSEVEDDEDADVLRGSQRSTPTSSDSAKRSRGNDHGSESPEIDASRTSYALHRRTTVNGHTPLDSPVDVSDVDEDSRPSKFQPGAILRVKLTNFVTYENAEFFPGPNLNMVIGPNGTGKSSLVCAICLGLGWGPQHLGRAQQVGEFVKHGMSDAHIEIELQRRPNESSNYIVRVRIIRDGNGREWFLNNKKTSLKAVQTLTRSLSIQIDNLCQFLPQDKVSEFAALSPVELLQQTQRAAAPDQMLDWHEELKKHRRDQKALEAQREADKEHFDNLERRQEGLRAEVQRLEERNQIQRKVTLLKKMVPFIEYKIARTQHMESKQKKKDAQRRLKELELQVQPTLQSVNHKQRYRDQIDAVVKDRRKVTQEVERAADDVVIEIQKLDENTQQIEQKVEAEHQAETARRQELQKLRKTLSDLKAREREEPIEFDNVSWNDRIRAKEHSTRGIEAELREVQLQFKGLNAKGVDNRARQDAATQELADFESQEGQQMNKVSSLSKETGKAWKWVQDNQGDFEKEVYGPPVISCSIKDPRYTNALESLLARNDLLCITAQTQADFKKLSDHLYGTMALGDVTLRTSTETLANLPHHPLSADELRRCGLDGWALDFVDGPEPVLAMLSQKLHSTGVSLRDISEEQYSMLVQSRCNCWVVGGHLYKVNTRPEYGPEATSTVTRTIGAAKFWTNGPVDQGRRREIQAKIETLAQDYSVMKQENLSLREKIAKLQIDKADVAKEVDELRKEKAALQKAHGIQKALPEKIQREQEAYDKKESEGSVIRDRVRNLRLQHDHAVLRKAAKALRHKEAVEKIRRSHEELLEAEIRLIEAKSDLESLEERNKDIVQGLEQERRIVREKEHEAKEAHDSAARALEVCQEIRAEAEVDGTIGHFQEISQDLTLESLDHEIAAEESKLDFIHANNPNAIQQFENRQREVDKLKEKIVEADEKLDRLGRSITKVRGKWEPELDKLIAEISDAFSHNFEQIGCAGEVSVHKDDDFEAWAIQIKVKFRENETLQLLDQHRQSGGERSVSTIFYLMSLQSLARAPFRVVDEINQGMDPRNERMVHERMVEIACKEHTSQYFLITPKLLTNLRYDRRMKVLCIASGEYMPKDYRNLDVGTVINLRRAMVAAG